MKTAVMSDILQWLEQLYDEEVILEKEYQLLSKEKEEDAAMKPESSQRNMDWSYS